VHRDSDLDSQDFDAELLLNTPRKTACRQDVRSSSGQSDSLLERPFRVEATGKAKTLVTAERQSKNLTGDLE